jgi:isoquinoline 1-oxidoreductase beta subunit
MSPSTAIVAQVAEVTVQPPTARSRSTASSAPSIAASRSTRTTSAAQVEGGIGFALSAALYGEITLKDGVVEQGNFDGYPLLRINEMPKVEVHIVPSAAKPTGIGEPGVPPLAPAVANAIGAATGKILRDDGQVQGSVSGGCIEDDLIGRVQRRRTRPSAAARCATA